MIGSAPAAYGYKNALLGFMKSLKSGNTQELLNSGKLLRNYMDLSFDPRSPIKSIINYGSQAASSLNTLSLHVHDILHAATAQVWADSMKNGRDGSMGKESSE